MLLDLSLTRSSGLAVLDRIRKADGVGTRIDPALPVIILSGRADELDRVRGFGRGADDYVVKPFSYPELLARVNAVLRRSEGRVGGGVVTVGELSIDPTTREVWLGDKQLTLSVKEFALRNALQMRFYAQADRQINQGSAPFRPFGWGDSLLAALSDCIGAIRRHPYEPG